MHPVETFSVRPALPERLKALEALAIDLGAGRGITTPSNHHLAGSIARSRRGGGGSVAAVLRVTASNDDSPGCLSVVTRRFEANRRELSLESI
jgi:hypothetical protein